MAVNGTTYNTTGIYTNVVGCNTETLNLTINQSTNNTTTAIACDSYTWAINGTTYNASGTYTNIIGCNTETLNLTINPSTNNVTTAIACDSYTWAINGTTYNASGTYTNIIGCNTETLNLTINPSTNNTTTATACDSYTWAVNGTTYNTTGVYTNIVGCNTETLNLIINPVGIADFTLSADSGFAPLSIGITDNSLNASDYLWVIGADSFRTILPPNTIFEQEGTYLIKLFINTNSCVDSMIKTVVVKEQEIQLFIPNVFSPNGDGINDNFNVVSQSLNNFSVLIFDRWGLNCFESNNTNFKWDGLRNGSACPEGVYVYVIDCKTLEGKRVYRTGSITLVR